jgi:hypothetical protein
MRAALFVALALIVRPAVQGPAAQPSVRDVFELGRTRDQALWDAFNRGYALAPGGAIERAEVITEFRRAVLFVHDEVGKGQLTVTDQDLSKAMAPFAGRVSVVAEVRLHPLHTYPKPPLYDLYVETGRATRPIAATPLVRDPVYPPGVGPGTAMAAVRLEGSFPRADIESAAAPTVVVTDDQANVIWRARLDLARYR